MSTGTELFIAFGRIIASSLKGASNAILGSLAMFEGVEDDEDAETSQEEPLYGPLGWFGRPAPPVKTGEGSGNDPAGSPEFVGLRVGDRVIPIAYRDLRTASKVNPKEGEIGLVQYKGGFISLKDNDDGDGTSITIYAVRNDGSGNPDKASAIAIDSAAGNASISILHEKGHSISLTKDGNVIIMNESGDALVDVNADGVIINGNYNLIGAGTLGSDGATPGEPAMLSVNLLAWVAEVNAAISALAMHTHGGVTTGAGNTAAATGVTVPSTVPATSSTVDIGA